MSEKNIGVKTENCYIDRQLPSGRMLSQWRMCDPASMEAMSKAAVRFVLADAKTDITALAARVAELESKLERASQPGGGEDEDAARYRWLQARVFADRGRDGLANFGLHFPKPVRNPMFGSVAQHFDEAIDAARATLPSTD